MPEREPSKYTEVLKLDYIWMTDWVQNKDETKTYLSQIWNEKAQPEKMNFLPRKELIHIRQNSDAYLESWAREKEREDCLHKFPKVECERFTTSVSLTTAALPLPSDQIAAFS